MKLVTSLQSSSINKYLVSPMIKKRTEFNQNIPSQLQ